MTADLLMRGQLAALVARGFHVGVLASPGPRLDEVARREGVEVLPVPLRRRPAPLADLLALLRTARALRRFRPDLVNAGTPKAGLVVGLAARLVGVPRRLYTVRGLPLETARGLRRRLLAFAERTASSSAHRVVCVGESLRRRYVGLGLVREDKTLVLGHGASNGVDTERFHPAPQPGPDRGPELETEPDPGLAPDRAGDRGTAPDPEPDPAGNRGRAPDLAPDPARYPGPAAGRPSGEAPGGAGSGGDPPQHPGGRGSGGPEDSSTVAGPPAGPHAGPHAEQQGGESGREEPAPDALRRDLGLPADVPVVGFVGRFTRDKGIAELAGAFFGRLLPRFPEARLLLLGDFEAGDPVDPETRRRLEEDRRVLRPGFVPDPAPYYRLMDVLAFPSHREGFPNAPLEAAASAVPVAGYAATGTVDAVADGETGTLVPVGDAEALAAALLRYLEHPELRRRHGRAGRNRAVALFRNEKVWQAWCDLYVEELAAAGVRVPRS